GSTNVLDDLPRQRPDIRPPVSADFCLVPHASERNANEIAPHRISDRSPKRGLSHARRPDEPEDGRFTLGPQFKNSQVFEDAFFDFIEVIVIAVENCSRRKYSRWLFPTSSCT